MPSKKICETLDEIKVFREEISNLNEKDKNYVEFNNFVEVYYYDLLSHSEAHKTGKIRFQEDVCKEYLRISSISWLFILYRFIEDLITEKKVKCIDRLEVSNKHTLNGIRHVRNAHHNKTWIHTKKDYNFVLGKDIIYLKKGKTVPALRTLDLMKEIWNLYLELL